MNNWLFSVGQLSSQIARLVSLHEYPFLFYNAILLVRSFNLPECTNLEQISTEIIFDHVFPLSVQYHIKKTSVTSAGWKTVHGSTPQSSPNVFICLETK